MNGTSKKYIEISRNTDYVTIRGYNVYISDFNNYQKIAILNNQTLLKNNVVQVCNDSNIVSCQFSPSKALTDSVFYNNYFR